MSDPAAPDCGGTIASLAAGATRVFPCRMTADVGTTVNTAAASVTPADGPPLTPSDPAGFVVPQPYHVAKVANPASGSATAPGRTITYTVTVTEPPASAAPFPAPSLTDDLSDVLDDATYVAGSATTTVGSASVTGSTLSWSAPTIVPGQTITITYKVTVKDPDTGDRVIRNHVTTPPGNANCSSGSTDPDCTTIDYVPSYTVSKSATPGSTIEGGVVTYHVLVSNTGPVAYPATGAGAASFTDALTGVIDDAGYVAGSITATAGTPTVAGNTISWTGPLAVSGADSSVTITYQVKVAASDVGDHLLKNTVVPDGPGGVCTTAKSCSTTTPVASYTVAKASTPASTTPGGKVTYTVTVVNTGEVAYAATGANAASFTDDLSAVLDDATYNGDATGGATFTSPTLAWSGALAIGATATITYSVTVNTPDTGNHVLTNAVAPDGAGGTCATPASCTTNTPVASYTVAKAASTTTTTPGGVVTYTVTVVNTGATAYIPSNPASFSDNLSAVLDDATYDNDADNGAVYAAPNLIWSGALAVGATVTITYTATVHNPDVTGNHSLDNTVVPDGAGGSCATVGGCTVQVLVQSFRVAKSTSATEVTPGEVVPYTITVTNTGKVAYTAGDPATLLDDLSAVTDDAVLNLASVTASAGTVTPTGGNLAWSGLLPVGGTVTITYTVTVNTPDAGDKHLDNTIVTPPGSGANCPTGSTDPACQVHLPSKAYAVVKTASAQTANPGDKVTYTLLVTNTGTAAYPADSPATYTDSLAGVLDDATYNGDASGGAQVSGSTLTWSGALDVGASTTITYSVTVKAPDTGDKLLHNTVSTPAGSGGNCTVDSTDPGCQTVTPVRSYTVAKTSTPATRAAGGVVTYTITVTNTGQADYPATGANAATFTDDLSTVLDDATYDNDATHGATVTGNTLSWTGALLIGTPITITYSVTVNNPDTGDHLLTNAVTPTGPGGACATAGGCATVTPVRSYTVAKTSSPGSTSPGGVVTYTVTVVNTGKVAYTAAAPASLPTVCPRCLMTRPTTTTRPAAPRS